MRKVFYPIFTIAIVVASYTTLYLQRHQPDLRANFSWQTLGAFHVHSDESHDSELSLEKVVRTAKELGLSFVFLNDHNHQNAGPRIVDGVLVMSFAELSTPYGHVIGLGARDLPSSDERQKLNILDRIEEMGGFPVLAHPVHHYNPWRGALPNAGGFEVYSASTAARRLAGRWFVRAIPWFFRMLLRPDFASAELLARPDENWQRFDALRNPGLVALCGSDAHGLFDLRANLSLMVLSIFDLRLTGDAATQQAQVLDSISKAETGCTSPLFGSPQLRIDWDAQAETIRVERSHNKSNEATLSLVLYRNGESILRSDLSTLNYRMPGPGLYRAELEVLAPVGAMGHKDLSVAFSRTLNIPQAEANEISQ